MSDVTGTCLICGEFHAGSTDVAAGCPTMKAVQARDARPKNVPPEVYTAYLAARDALRANTPRTAVKGLRDALGAIAVSYGARNDASFAEKMEKLCAKGVIGARIREALLGRALSDSSEEAQAWALMSLAEHAFYSIYLTKTSPGAGA